MRSFGNEFATESLDSGTDRLIRINTTPCVMLETILEFVARSIRLESGGNIVVVEKLTLRTETQCFVNITEEVGGIVNHSGVENGLCVVFCPHTTAGITINENADPDVVEDILVGLDHAYPDRVAFKHYEGNSAAHLKASAVGSSATVVVQNGRMILGRWQGIYFCEFDGPRVRTCIVSIQ